MPICLGTEHSLTWPNSTFMRDRLAQSFTMDIVRSLQPCIRITFATGGKRRCEVRSKACAVWAWRTASTTITSTHDGSHVVAFKYLVDWVSCGARRYALHDTWINEHLIQGSPVWSEHRLPRCKLESVAASKNCNRTKKYASSNTDALHTHDYRYLCFKHVGGCLA